MIPAVFRYFQALKKEEPPGDEPGGIMKNITQTAFQKEKKLLLCLHSHYNAQL